MQNTTEFTGMKGTQRLEQLIASGSYPLLCCCYALGGAVAALAKIVGGAAPFGVAFAAAVPFRFTLPATLGMAVGYLAGCGIKGGYRYIAAGFLVTLIRWLLRPERWERRRSVTVPLVSAAAVLGAGVLPVLYSQPLLYDIIMWATQVIIAGAAASFMDRALVLLDDKRSSKTETTALWVVFAIAIMGLCTLELGGVSAGRIAAAAAVLLAARVGGVVPATMTGVLCGFGAGFAVGDFTLYVTIYSLGGLLAGVFSAFGRVGSAIAFSATYGFVGLLSGGSSVGFIEVAVAAVLFLLLPSPWLKIFGAVAVREGDGSTVKAVIGEQLQDTTAALRDVAKTTGDVAVRLGRMHSSDVGAIYDRAGERICRRCPKAMQCWQPDYNDTVDALAHGLRQVMAAGAAGPDDFPPSFSHCPRRKELGVFLQQEHRRQSSKDEDRRRAAQTRRLLTDQMEGLALLMEDVAAEVGEVCTCDNVLEAKVEAIFEEYRLEPRRVACWRNRHGQLTVLVEIPQYKESRCTPELLARDLAEPCRTPMAFPIITRSNKVSRLTFHERPKYTLEYGSHQINCGSNALCGDSFRIINTTGTVANLLLSDGMGSGNSAAVDSAMAASLITRLLEAGVSYPAALKLINGALLVKSGDESMATIDAAQVDLYTGRVRLYKAGAAPTVVRKEGRGIEIDSTSLPAGILDEVEFQQSQITLEEGDMLLLLSDGAVPEGGQWIARAVESFESGDLDQFCKKLATTAKLRRTDGKDDDITVLCCRLVQSV